MENKRNSDQKFIKSKSEEIEYGLTDLHIHTNASDGTWDILTLIKKLKKHNIRNFSITDHDTFLNSERMLRENLNGFNYVIGVEVSSMVGQNEYHILAYDFDYNNKPFHDLLTFNQNTRKDYDGKIIEYIKTKKILRDVSDFREYRYNRSRGGWDSLNYLIDKGVISNKMDFFSLIEKLDVVPEFKEPKEVIEVIKKAGGTPILAHPTNYHPVEKFKKEILDRWIRWGIKGIECYSPYLKQKSDADIFIDYCKENHLLITSGSDCHGDFLNRPLGYPNITLDHLVVSFF